MRTFKKIPLDVTLVVAATLFVAMKLSMIVVAFMRPAQEDFLKYVFWVAYPLIAFIWGVASHPADYKWWLALLITLVGMGAGLTFWNGYLRLLNLPVYLAVAMIGYIVASKMFKAAPQVLPKKKKKI